MVANLEQKKIKTKLDLSHFDLRLILNYNMDYISPNGNMATVTLIKIRCHYANEMCLLSMLTYGNTCKKVNLCQQIYVNLFKCHFVLIFYLFHSSYYPAKIHCVLTSLQLLMANISGYQKTLQRLLKNMRRLVFIHVCHCHMRENLSGEVLLLL